MPVGTKGAVRHLSVGRPVRPRRPDRAGQHLPPDAQAGSGGDPGASAACTASPTGRATCSPTRAATRSSRSSPAATSTSTTTASRSAPPTTAARTGSRPESAVEIQTAFGSDIQMVLDVCAPLPSDDAVLRSAVDRTAAWAARARPAFREQDRPDLNQFGIVQGGTDLGAAGRERRAHPRGRLRRLRDRWPVGRGVARRDARDAGRHAAAPSRGPAALPHGPRRPAGDGRGGRARHRPVRLRAPHALRPARHDPLGRRSLQPEAGREHRTPTARSTSGAVARSAPAGPGPTCGTCWWSTSRPGPG